MAEPSTRARRLPWILVGVAVAFNLWTLRAELLNVWYLNDAGIHQSMVRWAAMRMREGHLPFDGWYPYLSLGASRFHHYQSLPHILTGAISTIAGPGTFRWSLYLLLCTWPIAVYCGGRLFDLEPWAAGVAALVSPLIVSAPALGFEWSSYVWRGSGTWAQLWGMWALPFAWGLSWRAVSKGRTIALAALVLGITVCLHLLIGYLALLSLGVWVVLSPKDFWRRVGRAALVGIGALATAAWMLVPLITDAKWMTQDEFSRGTFYYDSFGARRVLGWLVTGRIFDNGRFPTVSVLALVGFAVCVWRFRRSETARAVLGVGLLSVLLFFGRPTLGAVIDLLPGGTDLFLRRYVTGVHLAGIYLGGDRRRLGWSAGDAPCPDARDLVPAGVRRRACSRSCWPRSWRRPRRSATPTNAWVPRGSRTSEPPSRRRAPTSPRSWRRPRRPRPAGSTAACGRTGWRRRSISSRGSPPS